MELGPEERAVLGLWARATQPSGCELFVEEALAVVRDRLRFDDAYVVAGDSGRVLAATVSAPALSIPILDAARDAHRRRATAELVLDDLRVFMVSASDGTHVLALRTRGTRGVTEGDAAAFARVVVDAVAARLAGDAGTSVASRDRLTLLPNRVSFLERLAEIAAPAALLRIDLDGFAAVNEREGRPFGDVVLAEVAHRLRVALPDAFVARLEGDAFVAIVQPLERAEVGDDAAQRVLAAVAQPVRVDGTSLTLAASIGVALAPEDGSGDALLGCAEAALTRAKDAGGRRVRFSRDDVHERVERRRRILVELDDDVLAREFLLCYQPIVDAVTGALAGVEALPRWHHPRDGLLTAATIVAALDGSPFVASLDAWVLAEARREAARLRRAGLDVPIHVNIGSIQADVPTVAGSDGPAIALELPERIALGDVEAARRFCTAARERGYSVGIDRFGASPVRIAEIARLPLDFVKLDRALFFDPALFATVAFAHSLGCRVIAWGVASAPQCREIAEAGIDALQGYAVGPPMTATDLIEWAGLAVSSLTDDRTAGG